MPEVKEPITPEAEEPSAPVVEEAAVEVPVEEPLVVEAPVVEVPVEEPLVVEAPVEEAPVEEPLVVEAPVEEEASVEIATEIGMFNFKLIFIMRSITKTRVCSRDIRLGGLHIMSTAMGGRG